MRVQLVASHGWINPTGRVGTPASRLFPLKELGVVRNLNHQSQNLPAEPTSGDDSNNVQPFA